MIGGVKDKGMDSQELLMLGGFIAILAIATTTVALADETILIQSGLENKITLLVPHGHIEDISWVERVSNEGTIEISGITFSVINNDDSPHSFETCIGIDRANSTASKENNSIACTYSETVEKKSKLSDQKIDLSEGVKVSDLKNISISIKEF